MQLVKIQNIELVRLLDFSGVSVLSGQTFPPQDLTREKPAKKTTEILNNDDATKNATGGFLSLIRDFAASTTAHGIGKVFAADSMVRRALWLLGCLTVYAVMIFMCAQLLVRYLEKPVVSRVEVSYEESLVFPAVTICNLNMLKHSKVAKNPSIQSLMTNMKEKDEKMRYQPLTPLNTTAAPKDDLDKKIDEQKHRQIKKLMQEAVSSKEKQIFQGAEVDTTSIMGVMLMGSLRNVPSDRLAQMGYSLDDLLVSCRWSAFKCNSGTLKDLWKHFWHWKYGNCYTFNSGVSANGEKMPILTVDRSGPYDGLSMVIDVKQDQYNPFVDEAGIRVVLTDQQKMPFPFEEGFSVPTGFSTSVGVRRVYTRRVDPHGNNSCASSDEESIDDIYKKRYFVNYSVKGTPTL
ncbi:predicted protein [Nematostella vectensis]|uniref:Uncharacterized protein n=1 Tax=Nematostella vectensis TaxID=45351 RepID=A7SP23_NEMVE|nr:predicted protein [Nematostella vectensis]|eukprot:XP_001626632.1 predicted protein [Nematostella vectensis]